MDPQFEELATRLASHVSGAVSAAEKRLTERIDDAERRLTDGARMHRENLETLVKMAADGYGATLESIDRRLEELNTKWGHQGYRPRCGTRGPWPASQRARAKTKVTTA